MTMIRLGLTLMLITAIASGGLALLNNVTAPIIAEVERQEQESARNAVVSSLGGTLDTLSTIYVENGDTLRYWLVRDTQTDEVIGYVAMAQRSGYSSNVKTMCGFDSDFNVVGLQIVSQQETPGLGTRAEEPAFLEQFNGRSSATLDVTQDGGEINAITAATITSRAVTVSIREIAQRILTAVRANEAIANAPVEIAEEAVVTPAEEVGQ